jgi:hypothetical protein
MSPDIEWHVGEEAKPETIARTSSPRRSRRSRWAVISAIGLGVGLALLYRSIPEPSRPIDPAPAPAVFQSPSSRPLSPLPTPQTLEAAIQRDALRLAAMSDTDSVTFDPALSQMLPAYADWYAALQNAYGSWGPITPLTPYTVFETGTLPGGVAWVKLGQFRNGDFFRHMRFYRWHDDRWVWTLPELEFWTGSLAEVATGDASPIGPVSILHTIEDAPVVGAVLDRFTRAYQNLCESLKCPRAPSSSPQWTPGLALTLAVLPRQTEATVQERDNATLYIELPSPRVVGYYEDPNGRGDPFTAMAYDTLIAPTVRLASGDYARWKTDRGGELFLQAITTWKRARIQEALQPLELFYPPAFLSPASTRGSDGELISLRPNYIRLLQNNQRLPLDSVWNWDSNERAFGLLQHVAVNEARVAIIFIEDRFGADGVVRFLNALGRAGSLEEAIEAGLSIEYSEFLKQWRQWSNGE